MTHEHELIELTKDTQTQNCVWFEYNILGKVKDCVYYSAVWQILSPVHRQIASRILGRIKENITL